MVVYLELKTNIIECFNQCAKQRNYRQFIDSHKDFLKPLLANLKQVTFETGTLPAVVARYSEIILDYLIKFDPNNPTKVLQQIPLLNKFNTSFLHDLESSIRKRNWDEFYSKYAPEADFIISEARRQKVFDLTIEFDTWLHENLEQRDFAQKYHSSKQAPLEVEPIIPRDTHNSKEMLAWPSQPNHLVKLQERNGNIGPEKRTEAKCLISPHQESPLTATNSKYAINSENEQSLQNSIIDDSIKKIDPISGRISDTSGSKTKEAHLDIDLRPRVQYYNDQSQETQITVEGNDVERCGISLHHQEPPSTATNSKYATNSEYEQSLQNSIIDDSIKKIDPISGRISDTSGSKAKVAHLDIDLRPPVQYYNDQSQETQITGDGNDVERCGISLTDSPNRQGVFSTTSSIQQQFCWVPASNSLTSFSGSSVVNTFNSDDLTLKTEKLIDLSRQKSYHQEFRGWVDEDSEDLDSSSFEKQILEQNERFAKELEERKKKRQRRKEELEEEFKRMKTESLKRFEMLLHCINLKARFTEQEQQWSDWIQGSRQCIVKLINHFYLFYENIERNHGGLRNENKVNNIELQVQLQHDINELVGIVMKTFNLMECDFEYLKELERQFPDVLFIRVLQKCVADVASKLLIIYTSAGEKQFQDLQKTINDFKPEMIYSIRKLREISERNDFQEMKLYHNVKFPPI